MSSTARFVLFVRRVPALLPWLGEARTVMLFLGVVVVAFVSTDWIGACINIPRTQRLTRAGWALETIGLLWIAIGIWHKEQQFGKPSLPRVALDWLSRFPLRTRHYNLQANTGRLTLTGHLARLTVWSTPPSDADLEARIASLERNVDHLRDATERDYEEHEKNIADLRSELAAERDARTASEAASAKKVESAMVGGVSLEYMSFFWVLLGLAAATVPELVHSFFDGCMGSRCRCHACRDARHTRLSRGYLWGYLDYASHKNPIAARLAANS